MSSISVDDADDGVVNSVCLFISYSFLFHAVVLSVLWFGDPAEGAAVSPVDGHGPPGDAGQGAVLRVALPTTRTNLPHDGLSQ